jgi:two-component system chemotaxis response regulator CheV
MIMDVEKVLSEVSGFYADDSIYDGIPSMADANVTVLFADDSSVARGQICRTLDEMGIKYISTVNGQDAWEKLNEIAAGTEAKGGCVTDQVHFILTDIEMPEMDGYVLTRKIKEDPRFAEIPVVMHSSLSAEANQSMGERVGADAYVAKFEPLELATTLVKIMSSQKEV